MFKENRKYNFIGELILKRSKFVTEECRPKDDLVTWFFVKLGKHQYSFIYNILNPLDATYGKPFQVELAFLMIEEVAQKIELNVAYEILRGEESIGTLKLIQSL